MYVEASSSPPPQHSVAQHWLVSSMWKICSWSCREL